MVRVLLEFDHSGNGSDLQRFDLELDPSEGVSMLRFQIYSLTDVPPDAQEVYGLNGSEPLKDSADLTSLTINTDQQLVLRRKSILTSVAPGPATDREATGTSAASSVFIEETCTRTFVHHQPVCQPGAIARGQHHVCVGCAQNCFLSNEIRPRLVGSPFVCQCGNRDHMCLFSERAGTQEPFGVVREKLKDGLRNAANLQIQRATAQSQQVMQRRLWNYAGGMQQYEDAALQGQALKVLPLEELNSRARERVENEAAAHSASGSPVSLRDALLLALMQWFKHEFFQWVNSIPCQQCKGPTSGCGQGYPTPDEARFDAGTVELYKCCDSSCGAVSRFPRYNHAGKLLETRRGRCGEWANAFTLFCRALQFETRLAFDWTDHVWNEVYSDSEQRWVHVDPCENARDAPLMYETGWGKKLTYVIAFSAEEAADVTKRYTRLPDDVMSRRTECSEDWLAAEVAKINQKLYDLLLELT